MKLAFPGFTTGGPVYSGSPAEDVAVGLAVVAVGDAESEEVLSELGGVGAPGSVDPSVGAGVAVEAAELVLAVVTDSPVAELYNCSRLPAPQYCRSFPPHAKLQSPWFSAFTLPVLSSLPQ